MKTHILCLGDSNTHGYCADPNDCADHGIRFNEDERWTCRLQKALGDEYLVTEEGLSGRTTVFVDPIHESMDALSVPQQSTLLALRIRRSIPAAMQAALAPKRSFTSLVPSMMMSRSMTSWLLSRA